MTVGASSAVVAVVMSSTYTQYSNSVVNPTSLFSHFVFEFHHGHPQGKREKLPASRTHLAGVHL